MMTSHKLLMKFFAVLSMVMVVTTAFAFLQVTGARAASVKAFMGTPRSVHFSGKFSDAALATSQLAHWSSSFTYQGKTYPFSMVGTDPSKGSATTTVPVTIVPLKLTLNGKFVFDGTQKVQNVTSSPIFQNAPFSTGTTQYGDTIQRTEFWNSVGSKSPNYHVLLGTPTSASTVSMNVPVADGTVEPDPSGKYIGVINVNWFDARLQSLLISLKFTPNMLPIFLSDDIYLYQGNVSQCCIGGYHNAVTTSSGIQTYAWATDSDPGVQMGHGEDVSALSHELSEWLNDPFTNNTVPAWMVPSQPQYGCSSLLETGDPLVGTVFTVQGFSGDHLQDEAFFSWFARQAPSIAYKGLYTYLGTFKTYSPSC